MKKKNYIFITLRHFNIQNQNQEAFEQENQET